MSAVFEPVLVVDGDPIVLGVLMNIGRFRGLEVIGASLAEAAGLLPGRSFGVAIVHLGSGGESGLEMVRQLREHDPSTESIVISSDDWLSSALESYAQDVFAFVPKPFDPVQLFATVDRALERRRGALERRRLTWELGLLNEVAAIVASSLDIAVVMQRAAERVATAFEAEFVTVRLRPSDGDRARVVATVGLDRAEVEDAIGRMEDDWLGDRTLKDGEIVRVDDASAQPIARTDLYRAHRWMSSLAVPIAVSDDVLGVIVVSSLKRARFVDADGQLLQTIGRQFAVTVTNGQLYESVHRAKVEWERTFDAISDPIAVFDGEARTMRVNAALAHLRGWRITETRGRTCTEVGLCGGECPDCVVGTSARENRSIDREITTHDGRIFAVTTLPVTGRSGAVVQFAKEVTEERRRAAQLRELSQELRSTNTELLSTLDRLRSTQAQLVQSEKLSAIGLLVAGVAHELNNPLTSIIGYAQLVHEELASLPSAASAEGLSDDVGRILSESDRAASIVRNLLTFARRQSSERGRQDVAELCARVVQLRAYDCRLKGIDVVTNFTSGLPPVYADGGQIQQTLLNLVLNAERAVKDSVVKRIEASVSAAPECGAVLVEVSDTGHGIDVGNLRRVFDPFFTTRGVGEGTGLGLSIAYGIVRDHGGQIWAESRPDERTSFFVRLPARVDGPIAEAAGTVLVAHADSVVREFISAVLTGWGFQVRSAHNLREALESLAEDDPGVALVGRSVVEPDPARWWGAWDQRRRPTILIAIASGSAEDDTTGFLRAHARAAIAAPYELEQIRRAMFVVTGARA